MLVEHTFVTTLTFPEVYERAASFLQRLGFAVKTNCWKCDYDLRGTIPSGGTRCPECGAPMGELMVNGQQPRSAMSAHKGTDSANKAKQTEQLPQSVRLEYDRGRINLAASVFEKGKIAPVHREMVLAMAEGLEMALVHGEIEDGLFRCRRSLDSARDYDEELKAKRQKGCIIAVVICILFFALIIALVSASRP